MKSTANEVASVERAMLPRIAILAEALEVSMRPYLAAAICWSILGFSKPHNSSRKPLARLKHSLTVLTLERMRYFK